MSQARTLITGATSGIGRATAIAFAKAGYDLVLLARSTDKLSQLQSELEPLGVTIEILTLDLYNLAAIPAALAPLVASRPIDVLINNAGMAYTGSLADMPLADWQRLFDLNLGSVLQCIQAVLPGMRAQKQGLIVNIGSIAATTAFPNWGAYCASKAALQMLSKALSTEERGNGIRVSTVSPGAVNTGIWDTETVQADFDRSQMLTPEAIAQGILQVAQMSAVAWVEEITILPSAGTF